MQKNFLLFFTLFLCLNFKIFSEGPIAISIEPVETETDLKWGLMGRKNMPENHGMLFTDIKGSLWMFNVQFDLSVAFIDKTGLIFAIKSLKSYPEMMDPKRPILTIQDLEKYPKSDPIYHFFLQRAVSIPKKTHYVLEMNKDFFTRYDIARGDRFVYQKQNAVAYIYKNEIINLNHYID